MPNFIRRVIVRIAPGVLDARERENTSLGEPAKAIDAIRWLEPDAHARCGHDGVKIASDRMLHGVCIGQPWCVGGSAKRKTFSADSSLIMAKSAQPPWARCSATVRTAQPVLREAGASASNPANQDQDQKDEDHKP